MTWCCSPACQEKKHIDGFFVSGLLKEQALLPRKRTGGRDAFAAHAG